MSSLFYGGKLPKTFECQGKKIHFDDTVKVRLDKGIELEELISSCDLDGGEIIKVEDISYPISGGPFLALGDNVGAEINIRLDSQREAWIVLPNAKSLMQDFDVEKRDELVGKRVACYRLPPQFKSNGEYLGLSANN